MISYWEQQSFIEYSHIVVGAGLTGLSTACEIKEANPSANILVLERGLLPTGASTKNAGFACVGSLSEMVHDLQLMGEEKLLNLVNMRWQGLNILRTRLGDQHIDFQCNGGHELLFTQHDDAFLNEMDAMNARLKPIFNQSIFSVQNHKIKEFGLNANAIKEFITCSIEGQIDSGKMMKKLWQCATSIGVHIITGAEVISLDEQATCVEVNCKSNFENIKFKAGQIFICTNAFTKTLFPEIELNPGRGQVILTSEISNLKLRGTFHFEEGYYYFRNINNRILFGGGRNLAFETETTTEFKSNETITQRLIQYLREDILPNDAFTIEQEWSGIMGFSSDKQPLIKAVSDRIIMGVRLNGMGVAIGSMVAKKMATLTL